MNPGSMVEGGVGRRVLARARAAHGAAVAVALPMLLAFGGCATRSADVQPLSVDRSAWAGWSCERLDDEADRAQQQAADVAYAVDARAGNNVIALGVGLAVFWPALLAMRPDGDDAQRLAQLKGRFEALRAAARTAGCPPPQVEMPLHRAAALPVALGETLVYEERAGARGIGHRLLLRIEALQRQHMLFSAQRDGQALPGRWQQDLQGNAPAGADPVPVVSWRRLLRPELQLGQVLEGDLALAGERQAMARLRGQVVAVGPQVLDGRRFDVAVVELFGDAPVAPGAVDLIASTRLDGVLAVDRRSGVVLRLDLRCANPDYTLRRRLVRVEPAAGG